jgi:hypothetical protein
MAAAPRSLMGKGIAGPSITQLARSEAITLVYFHVWGFNTLVLKSLVSSSFLYS